MLQQTNITDSGFLKPVIMIPKQEQAQLDRLNQSLQDLCQTLDSCSHEQLNKQPNAETWSPLMVAKHLILVEGYAAQYVRKKLSFDPKIAKAGVPSKLRSVALDLYFKSPLKRKAPQAAGDDFVVGEYKWKEMKAEWLAQRVQLEELLSSLPADRFLEEVYKHPFAGRMSLKGMLRFFQGHFDRHRKQLESRL